MATTERSDLMLMITELAARYSVDQRTLAGGEPGFNLETGVAEAEVQGYTF